ncbi:50S ribosomal protein L24 [bacterium]|nr:50S ribosomal protein L24 [bacterium]MCK4597719.1 50S ribosomal protein L24 [bacterium]
MKVLKGDTVVVISGNDQGKMGKVLKVEPGSRRIIVEGIHFIKRHTRPSQKSQKGGIVEKEAPIKASNVLVYCPKCDRGVRVGRKALKDGRRVRFCRRCGEMFT